MLSRLMTHAGCCLLEEGKLRFEDGLHMHIHGMDCP